MLPRLSDISVLGWFSYYFDKDDCLSVAMLLREIVSYGLRQQLGFEDLSELIPFMFLDPLLFLFVILTITGSLFGDLIFYLGELKSSSL